MILRTITIALLVTATVSLGACKDTENRPAYEGVVFRDAASCSRFFQETECSHFLDAAKRIHAGTATKFSSEAACETAFGKGHCQPGIVVTSEGREYLPQLTAFTLRSLDQAAVVAPLKAVEVIPLYPARPGDTKVICQPEQTCRLLRPGTPEPSFYSSGGVYLGATTTERLTRAEIARARTAGGEFDVTPRLDPSAKSHLKPRP